MSQLYCCTFHERFNLDTITHVFLSLNNGISQLLQERGTVPHECQIFLSKRRRKEEIHFWQKIIKNKNGVFLTQGPYIIVMWTTEDWLKLADPREGNCGIFLYKVNNCSHCSPDIDHVVRQELVETTDHVTEPLTLPALAASVNERYPDQNLMLNVKSSWMSCIFHLNSHASSSCSSYHRSTFVLH